MTRHNELVRFKHMLDFAREAVQFCKDESRSDLDGDRQLQLSVLHLVELIGEAASQIPKETRNKYSGIPWRNIIGIRNRIIHGYDFVDFNILWDTVRNDLPSLIEELDKIISDQEPLFKK